MKAPTQGASKTAAGSSGGSLLRLFAVLGCSIPVGLFLMALFGTFTYGLGFVVLAGLGAPGFILAGHVMRRAETGFLLDLALYLVVIVLVVDSLRNSRRALLDFGRLMLGVALATAAASYLLPHDLAFEGSAFQKGEPVFVWAWLGLGFLTFGAGWLSNRSSPAGPRG